MKRYATLALACLGLVLARPATAQTTRLDPSFQVPQILLATTSGPTSGVVNDVVQQPDGKYLIGGSFSSINGVRARNLARLNADGTLDAAFTAASQTNGPVFTLALQANGSVLAGGQFDSLAGGQHLAVGRLLPTGSLDAGFLPDLTANPAALAVVRQLGLLLGGAVVVLGAFSVPGQGATTLASLSGTTGLNQASFQPPATSAPASLAVQPGGTILLGYNTSSYVVATLLQRILPTGAVDASYAPVTTVYTSAISQLTPAPGGGAYAGGLFNSVANNVHLGLNRMLPTGGFDTSFAYQGTLLTGAGAASVTALAVQPNGRVLVAGVGAASGSSLTERLLPSGQPDPSYLAATAPRSNTANQGRVLRLLVQPDGAIMLAGSFTQAGTTPAYGLVRMLDANVLAASSQLPASATTAWPVPTQETLHVALEAAAGSQQVQLLDALGRPVLSQAVAAGTTALALDVAALPAGAYLLRITYQQAPAVTRRVVLQR